jgi:uncharacterized protein (DUF1697 family)
MTRWIAFLRAINVGGHTVKMDNLRRIFTDAGLSRVETYIASGNVIFDANGVDRPDLAAQLQRTLQTELGYIVDVFLRTPGEVRAITAYQPFAPQLLDRAVAFNVAFLPGVLPADSQAKLQTLATEIDFFHSYQTEVYWLCYKKQSESTFSNSVLERTLSVRSTIRGINIIHKLAEKYP